MAYIQFLGAAGTVTGSKHLVNSGGVKVLIDCGLFQGKKEWRVRNWEPLPIPAPEIDAVVLTHAHLDHCGWIPRLVKQGFRGPIYATPATIDLCAIVLPDSGHVQEEDTAFHNKHRTSKHHPALPLYTSQEATDSLRAFKAIEVHTEQQLGEKLKFRFVPAAHISGSAMVDLALGDGRPETLVFSGDIGRMREPNKIGGDYRYLAPENIEHADVLVMESTYGNRLHPREDVRPELIKLIRDTVARGGKIVVPAFAVERTQKFLFIVKDLMENGQIPRLPVHVDSPMAIKAVEVFLKHSEEFTPQTKQLIAKYGSPLQWPGFFFDANQEDSRRINDSVFPMIIVSSSGMVTGGRIQHHLIHNLADPKNTVIFIGFQAPGTRGALIQSHIASVKVFGQEVPVRAQIASLEQFSDHADTPELLKWLQGFKEKPRATYLVHGEPAASQALQQSISSELGWHVEVAQWMERVEIS